MKAWTRWCSWQRRRSPILVLFALPLLPLAALGEGEPSPQPEVPRRAYAKLQPAGAPIWVGEAEATQGSPGLRTELFEARWLDRLDRYAQRARRAGAKAGEGTGPTSFRSPDPDVDCVHFVAPPVPSPEEELPSTLAGLAREAAYLVAGTVTAISNGFYRGDPVSLLTLGDLEVVRYPDAAPGTVHVVYYHAAFVVGGQEYCSAGFPPRPPVGRRMIVAGARGPVDESGQLLVPSIEGVFVEDERGRLIAPARYGHEVTEDELRGLVSDETNHPD